MPYRTVGEDITQFLEDLVTEAQKQRLGRGPMAKAFAAELDKPKRSPFSTAVEYVQRHQDQIARELLEYGERIIVQHMAYDDGLSIVVIAGDGRKVERKLFAQEVLSSSESAIAMRIAHEIRRADAELRLFVP